MAKSKEPTMTIRILEPVHLHDVSNDIDFAIGDVVELPYSSAQRWIKRQKALEHAPEAEAESKPDDSGSPSTK